MREALLDSAVDHFGRMGFDGTSTRAIAADSGTAMSSITYHFGGKEGLYLAAADHIADAIALRQQPLLQSVAARPGGDAETALESLLELLDGFAELMLDPASEKWARFIIREQQEPTAAFDRLFAKAMQPMISAFMPLAATARPDLSEYDLRAACILAVGQVMIMRAGRAAVCRIMGSDTIDAELGAQLRRALGHNTRKIFSPPERSA